MVSDSKVLNIHEAAAFLGAHEQTIRKLARAGQIPCYKLGRHWRFRQEALLRWADGERSDGKTETLHSVLVIDDDESVCLHISTALKRLGFRVRQATSGQKGLELIAEEVPDIILLDLLMPGMAGPQFLEELRKTHPTLPVVIVTGYPDSDLMMKATQYAPLMLLAKPVDSDLLERTVRSVAGSQRSSVGQI